MEELLNICQQAINDAEYNFEEGGGDRYWVGVKEMATKLKDAVNKYRSWKPTEEQFNALYAAIQEFDDQNILGLEGLKSLYEDLKAKI